jgi:hypothetical protein
LETTELAIADANRALELKEDNTKAIAAKAEAVRLFLVLAILSKPWPFMRK